MWLHSDGGPRIYWRKLSALPLAPIIKIQMTQRPHDYHVTSWSSHHWYSLCTQIPSKKLLFLLNKTKHVWLEWPGLLCFHQNWANPKNQMFWLFEFCVEWVTSQWLIILIDVYTISDINKILLHWMIWVPNNLNKSLFDIRSW